MIPVLGLLSRLKSKGFDSPVAAGPTVFSFSPTVSCLGQPISGICVGISRPTPLDLDLWNQAIKKRERESNIVKLASQER